MIHEQFRMLLAYKTTVNSKINHRAIKAQLSEFSLGKEAEGLVWY